MKIRDEGTKKKDPSPSQKNGIQKCIPKGHSNNRAPKPPLIARSILERKKNGYGKPKKVKSLEEPLLATIMHLKTEVA
jgi:hypothetical protein